METSNPTTTNFNFEKIVNTLVRLGVLYLLFMSCIDFLKPFILILIWAAVIAISTYPIYNSFLKLFRGKKVWASLLITLIMLSILIIPSVLLMESLYAGLKHIGETYKAGQPLIMPPGERTANWPSIAKPVVDLWQLASDNMQAVTLKYSEQIKGGLGWLLGAFAGVGKGILQFVVSVIIAGVLLSYSESIAVVMRKIFVKLAGRHGEQFASITVTTIQNVVKGVLGVAVIQAAMAGLGFFIAGVPFAGLWTAACLVLAIIQVGSGPVAIPVAIYMFSVLDTVPAIILAVWLTITLVSDNILKPLLLGRGAPVPMLVIFLGAIGGFIFYGFLGLFLGAVILTIGYKLFLTWLEAENDHVI